ncbi:MAG: acireductone synthase [Acidobacteriota bacterium]
MTSVAGPVPSAYLLDVEGTTTPLTFVTDVLFPYARRHAETYLSGLDDGPLLDEIVAAFRDDHADEVRHGEDPPAWHDGDAATRRASVRAHLEWLMDEDRKSTALKMLQGRIWAAGYHDGSLVGEVHDDVPPALSRWSTRGVRVAIFSSGSVLAQKLLFAHTRHGDLTPFIEAHFDTTTGPKKEPGSYTTISRALGTTPEQTCFVSDVVAELDAARAAGMHTALAVREGSAPPTSHPVVRSFATLPS